MMEKVLERQQPFILGAQKKENAPKLSKTRYCLELRGAHRQASNIGMRRGCGALPMTRFTICPHKCHCNYKSSPPHLNKNYFLYFERPALPNTISALEQQQRNGTTSGLIGVHDNISTI